MSYVVEGVSFFGVTPQFGSISAGGIIIPASYIIGEVPLVEKFPAASEVPVLKEIHTQGFEGNEFVANLEVAPKVCGNIDSAVGHGMRAEGTSFPTTTTPVGGEHLDNIGEFEFLTPSFGSHMQCPLDLATTYQMFYKLDRVISLLFHRLDCRHMKYCSIDLIVVI
jgi:hypothetical protein